MRKSHNFEFAAGERKTKVKKYLIEGSFFTRAKKTKKKRFFFFFFQFDIRTIILNKHNKITMILFPRACQEKT
jgi:hypothetical protein